MIDAFRKTKTRIKFFEDYAKTHNFDPLIASNWYTQSREQLYSFKVFIIFCFSPLYWNVHEQEKETILSQTGCEIEYRNALSMRIDFVICRLRKLISYCSAQSNSASCAIYFSGLWELKLHCKSNVTLTARTDVAVELQFTCAGLCTAKSILAYRYPHARGEQFTLPAWNWNLNRYLCPRTAKSIVAAALASSSHFLP